MTLLWTILSLGIKVQHIEMNPVKTQVLKNFNGYINGPVIFLNNGVIEKNILLTSRFYSHVVGRWHWSQGQLQVTYAYQKPSLFYKNSIITSFGKQLQYETALLLPTLVHGTKHQAIAIGLSLNKKFSIKLIETIQWKNHQWIMVMRNGQIWYCGYSWKKFIKNLDNFSKKEIKNIIQGNYSKVFIIKNNLLLKNK